MGWTGAVRAVLMAFFTLPGAASVRSFRARLVAALPAVLFNYVCFTQRTIKGASSGATSEATAVTLFTYAFLWESRVKLARIAYLHTFVR